MELKFKLCDIGNHTIRLEGQTILTDEYIAEDFDNVNISGLHAKNRFKYSLTATLNIISYTSTKECNKILSHLFVNHESYLDESYFKIEEDGFYTFDHIVLPTVEWLKEELADTIDSIFINDPTIQIYVTDGMRIYKYTGTNKTFNSEYLKELEVDGEIDLNLIRSINTEGTTISRLSKNSFYVKYLRDCYIFYCKSILNQDTFKCLSDNISIKDFLWKRDFVWMAINAIKFYTEDGKLYEALRLLELVNRCGEMCNSTDTTKKVQGCGCNKA